MTRIVAERIVPYPQRITRQHSPRPPVRGSLTYNKFKDCLRWEFGFTCAVCLLHEVHFVLPGTGTDRTGLMTVEHIVLKCTAAGKPLEHDYGNCLLLCKRCNDNRGDNHSHQRPDGARLLNPISDVWADHFDVQGDCLEPKPGDFDAEYTRTAYGINDDFHTLRRRKLSSLILGQLASLRRDRDELARLDQELSKPSSTPASSGWLLTLRGRLVEGICGTLRLLQDLSGVPFDAPKTCRCKPPRLQVAPVVSEGWRDIPEVRVPDPPLPSRRRFRA